MIMALYGTEVPKFVVGASLDLVYYVRSLPRGEDDITTLTTRDGKKGECSRVSYSSGYGI
jgi:hypothetical protein